VEVHSWAEAKLTVGAFPGGSGAVVFAAGFNCTYTSRIDISGNVTITGTSSRVVCDAGGAGRFFGVLSRAELVLRLPITLKNGDGSMGQFIYGPTYIYSGGAILNLGGTIAIEGEATFESNYASKVSVYLPVNVCWPTAAC
jgi:hypothetical protein